MRSVRETARFVGAAAIVLCAAAAVCGQDGGGGDKFTLAERQAALRDRLARLESSMIKLSTLLEEREPEKAERLRDALQYTGSRRIKARFRELTEMLEEGRYSEAESRQEELLGELDALLTLLTSSRNEADRRREERRRLEGLKRDISTLLDEQTRLYQDALHLAEQAPESSYEASLLERTQREMQQRAEQIERGMRPSGDDEEAPGVERVAKASEQMQQAADRLGENAIEAGAREQRGAVMQLQQALDELEDVLRQVRKEESEETLAALEARLRGMLEREKRVRGIVERLGGLDEADWSRVDRLEAAEAGEIQGACVEECRTTLRLLLDEGTTVIVPVLLRQLGEDMEEIGRRLRAMDMARGTAGSLDDVIEQLEELLAAVERKREEDAKLEQQDGGGGGGESSALLPGSAELKLLKNSQLRLNSRTLELMEDTRISEGELERVTQRMSERQRQLAELARRMNER